MADVKEQKIIEYFNEVWKKNTGKEYDEISYPFARQDTWTGKVVMDFAKFILAKEEEKTKQRVDQILKEIKEIGKELEKNVKYFDKLSYVAGLHDGLTNVIVIIKKTFEVDEE